MGVCKTPLHNIPQNLLIIKVINFAKVSDFGKVSDTKMILRLFGQHPIRKSDFLKREYLIFPTFFCSLLIKYKPIILNTNTVLFCYSIYSFSSFCATHKILEQVLSDIHLALPNLFLSSLYYLYTHLYILKK